MCLCGTCSGVHKIVFGALLLLNAFIWPQWLGIDGWIKWLAVLLVVGGALMLIMKGKCKECCSTSCAPEPVKGKKKRRKK